MHLDRQIADENARLQEALSEIEFKSRKLRVAGNLDELFRAVEFGDTNQQMRLAGRKWRTKAERASRDAHAMYERARQFGQRPSYDEYWVQTGTVCPTPRHELPNVLPYASLLRLWESELMPVTQEAAPERSTRQRPPRASKPRSIEIRRGVEWALI
jgi:hypothetical protein